LSIISGGLFSSAFFDNNLSHSFHGFFSKYCNQGNMERQIISLPQQLQIPEQNWGCFTTSKPQFLSIFDITKG